MVSFRVLPGLRLIQALLLATPSLASETAAEAVSEAHLSQVRRLVSEQRFDHALAVLQEARGQEHPDVAALLIQRGQALAKEQPDEALASCQRALAIQEKALGRDHRDVGHALACLADLLPRVGGSSTHAATYQRRARELLQSPTERAELEQLARVRTLVFEKRSDEALALARPILERQERALGPEHPLVLQTLGLMAWAHFRADHDTEVEQLLQRILGVHQRRFWPGEVDSLAAMMFLSGEFHLSHDRLEQARESFDQVLFLATHDRGNGGPQWVEFVLPFPKDAEKFQERLKELAARLVARRQPLLSAQQGRRALEFRLMELEMGSGGKRDFSVTGEEERAESAAIMRQLTGRSRVEDEGSYGEARLELLMKVGRVYAPSSWRRLWEIRCQGMQIGAKYALLDIRVRQLSFLEEHGRLGSLEEIGFEPAPSPKRLYTFTLERVDERHFVAVARGRDRMEGDVWRLENASYPDNTTNLCTNVPDPFSLEPAPRDERERAELYARRQLERVQELLADSFFPMARQELERTLQLLDRAHVSGGWVLGQVLNLLGDLESQRGDFATARELFQRLVEVQRQEWGEPSRQVTSARLAFAKVLLLRGETESAEPILEKALRDSEAHPERRRERMGALENRAQVHLARKEWARAEPLLRQAMLLLESTRYAEVERGILLTELGQVYLRLGSPALAESFLAQAQQVFSELKLKDENLLPLEVQELLGDLHLDRGELATAQRLFERTAQVRSSVLGVDHPSHARSLNRLAAVFEARGDGVRSLVLRRRALDIEELNLQAQLVTGSEEQKRLFLATLEDSTRELVSLHVRKLPRLSAAAHLALTTLLQRKGRVLDVTSQTLRSLRARVSGEAGRRLDQLLELRARLATQVVSAKNLDPELYKQQLVELKAKVAGLESELGTLEPELRALRAPVTVEAVQHALPPGSVLVELFRLDEGSRSSYMAYVLHPEGVPGWVELPDAARIDEAAEAFRIAVATEAEDVLEKGRALDEVLMRPLRPLLREASHLILSPDGVLNLVPFAALVDEQGRYLIETRSVSYVTSGRDLLPRQGPVPASEPPLVLGDVDVQDAEGRGAVAGAQRRSMDLRDLTVPPVDKSDGEEVRDVAKVLGLSAQRVLTRERATELALRSHPSPRILHIVTHGFFLPTSDTIENPLLRSGLALAGFNRRRGGGSDDGVLTALEVSGLDLRATEMVVLAACETGIGDVRRGEGVYGLRRALVLAGARTQVMSLWKVYPLATTQLMVSWYQRLLAGRGRAEAMTDIQRAMLKGEGGLAPSSPELGSMASEPRLRGWRHPYYWASFIVSGDAGPLDMVGAPAASFTQERQRLLSARKHEVASLLQAAGREPRSDFTRVALEQSRELLALSQRAALRGSPEALAREQSLLQDELLRPPFAPSPEARRELLRALASRLEGESLPGLLSTQLVSAPRSPLDESQGSALSLSANALLQDFEALGEPGIRGRVWELENLLTQVERLLDPEQGSREQWRAFQMEELERQALVQLRRLAAARGTLRREPLEEELSFLAQRWAQLRAGPPVDRGFIPQSEMEEALQKAVAELEQTVAKRHEPALLSWLRKDSCQALQRRLRSSIRYLDVPEEGEPRTSKSQEKDPLALFFVSDDEVKANYRFRVERRGGKVSVLVQGVGRMVGDVWRVGPRYQIQRLRSACEAR
ncbi:CHAT domain-containing protein [Archangium violaceum]|uniref:CHAT domain-containing tetratricopeptide repeat protein n=1 Tax=Archangium violaceum TaxID=83451 RepID=UPI002B2C523C|nr:CHAT domain-containing protein [Archangium violaceum]